MIKYMKYSFLDYYKKFVKAFLLILLSVLLIRLLHVHGLFVTDNLILQYICSILSSIATAGPAIFIGIGCISALIQLCSMDSVKTRYLTNSISIHPTKVVIARILNALIIICGVLLAVLIPMDLISLTAGKTTFLEHLTFIDTFSDFQHTIQILLVAVLFIITLISVLQMVVFIARSFPITRKHLIISSIVIYYGINILIETPLIFTVSYSVPANLESVPANIEAVSFNAVWMMLFIYAVIRIAVSVFISIYLLNKKVEII